jgi:hypothetical protein
MTDVHRAELLMGGRLGNTRAAGVRPDRLD